MMRMPRWAWLATLAIGCGHPSTPAAPRSGGQGAVAAAPVADAAVAAPLPLDQDLPRLAERALKLYRDWKTAFAEAGTDCSLAAARMNAIADANADLIEANRRLYRDSHERVTQFRAELAKHQTELDASAQAIVESPTMAKCSMDPAFARALDRLGGEG
jgi:hypothetical protein